MSHLILHFSTIPHQLHLANEEAHLPEVTGLERTSASDGIGGSLARPHGLTSDTSPLRAGEWADG